MGHLGPSLEDGLLPWRPSLQAVSDSPGTLVGFGVWSAQPRRPQSLTFSTCAWGLGGREPKWEACL